MESKQVIAALGALAQETRLAIFRLLVEAGPRGVSVGRIGVSVGASPATLSFHLKELTHAGLIEPHQDGRYVYYAASYARMNKLLAFLTQNCCARDGACADPAGERARSRTAGGAPRRPSVARASRRRAAAQ